MTLGLRGFARRLRNGFRERRGVWSDFPRADSTGEPLRCTYCGDLARYLDDVEHHCACSRCCEGLPGFAWHRVDPFTGAAVVA